MGSKNDSAGVESDVVGRIMNLCEKVSQANRTREFLDNEVKVTQLAKLKSSMKSKRKGGRMLRNICETHAKGKRTENTPVIGSSSSCFECLEEYHKKERVNYSGNLDYLGWGLHGLFEQISSDESNDSTSTDDESYNKRMVSEARHKILRKLRRKKPDYFEIGYFDKSVDFLMRVENFDAEVRNVLRNSRNGDEKVKHKNSAMPKNNSKHEWGGKEFNDYREGCFDFSNEVQFKEKYSSTKFEFLAGVIHYYQKFLKTHPEESYPSVSELMIKSGQNICKDEEDIVVRYYDVLYKKGGRKKFSDSITAKGKNVAFSEQSFRENIKNKKKGDFLSVEELNHIQRTGTVDLSNKSIVNVPSQIWSLDKVGSERSSPNQRGSLPLPLKRTKINKQLVYLNLSHNRIRYFLPKGSPLDTLIQLSLTDNKIQNLPDEFGDFKNLQFLDLENNLLTILPDSICNLDSLKELNLRRNLLTELPNKLGNLRKLKSIDIRLNKLTKLPDTFEDLASLGNLNAAHNRLRSLPLDLNNLYNLIILDVSYNKLAELPMLTDMPKLLLINAMGNLIKEFPNFSNCKSLCEIRLDGNRIKTLVTENLKDCPVVQLTLSHNKIISIPENFYEVETLVLMDCTNNRLLSVPWTIARLKYLTCFRIEENNIINIDRDVIGAGSKKILETLLQNLLMYEGDENVIVKAKKEVETLYTNGESVPPSNKCTKLSEKQVAKTRSLVRKRMDLTTLDTEWIRIAEKYKVIHANLSKNKFRYIPAELKRLSLNLKELIFRENQVKTVPDFIGRMPLLNVLDLSFNCLDNLPLSMTSCHLTKLICRKNLFTSIPKVVFMILTIEHLDFSENMIKEIDVEGLRNLRKLSHLNLSKNEIKKLPSSLGYFINLRQLDVTDNPFKQPTAHIIRGGTQVIMKYLKRQSDLCY